jgi:hypothetical protein
MSAQFLECLFAFLVAGAGEVVQGILWARVRAYAQLWRSNAAVYSALRQLPIRTLSKLLTSYGIPIAAQKQAAGAGFFAVHWRWNCDEALAKAS